MRNFDYELNPIIAEDLSYITESVINWKYLANKTIMVTGGDGFIGSYLIKALLFANAQKKLNIRIVCVTRTSKYEYTRLKTYLNNPCLFTFQHDISKPLPSNFPAADIIIHAASKASPKYYGIDPVGTIAANAIGTMQLLEHANKIKASRFLFLSSGEIYGEYNEFDTGIPENKYGFINPLRIRSCYAESKRMGESMCAAWAHQYNLNVVIVRPFHTYGPGLALDDGRVFSDFIADVLAKRDIIIHSDGSARRCFCYVSDAIIGFITVLTFGSKSEAYNLANVSAETSILDLAKFLAKIYSDYEISIQFKPLPLNSTYTKSEIISYTPSVDKITLLGWRPKVCLEEGFMRTIQSYSQ